VIKIDGRQIGPEDPTYFIADIAANHDGSLERAKALIRLAHDAGADAAKFQHFNAPKIVSQYGFDHLKGPVTHQSAWDKDVVEVYADASLPADWTPILAAECRDVGITFLSTPYDRESVDLLDLYVPAFKVGSGDIDWIEHLDYIASKGKPVILAAGAADLREVEAAVATVLRHTDDIVIMQCNTNYTGAEENLDHLNVRVVTTLRDRWPAAIVGLSDHTPLPEPVVATVALGGRVIERHFTDDTTRTGPDHHFALDPSSWRDMVDRVRVLERVLGNGEKVVEANEYDSAIVQRRCLRFRRALPTGSVISRGDIDVLRPATPGALTPDRLEDAIGSVTTRDVEDGEAIKPDSIR
jgi:sialic acid synthase SpsE